ncbi:hypothetical protein REJC140_03162 [Pseudorhizobium endolithicum]|uniref:Uncharacterized protein n=1 Tax=Pseudorhizobium endolithicum TaxID=1191678 RepID=A0ABN7JMS4_9HYPH|nr:hypothetical protein [Pseudorhizobium endolithicum]CAD6418842.1 hypothetical protein REQ54_01891 [Rhizobium sp. Q54]CAD7033253.1 hypothetical protein REJC140_03162 [Pseudorhizobium endolithicum]
MIWKLLTSLLSSDSQPATGTYPDGLFPVLAAKDMANESDRNFRTSYGRDYSLARKLDGLPQSFA